MDTRKGRIPLLLASLAFIGCVPPKEDPGDEGSSGDDDQEESAEGQKTSADDDDDPSAEDSGTSETSGEACELKLSEEGAILVDAVNNYAFASTLSVSKTTVASRTLLDFDWTNLTVDFIGHALDPLTDVNLVSLILWQLPYDELVQRINDDNVDQNAFVVLATYYTDGTRTTADVEEFTVLGAPIPEDQLFEYLDGAMYPPTTHTYTVMAATGTEPGQGTRMLALIEPRPDETNTLISLEPDSTQLTYTADLTTLQRFKLPAITEETAIDWSQMETNGLGHTFERNSITDIMIARYDLTPEELELQFLDIELIASDMYRAEVPFGEDIALSELTNEAGEAFSGISDDGTWVLALTCGFCRNPAPWFLTILESCEE